VAESKDIKYYILGKEIPLDLLDLMLKYVSEFREKGIEKTSYQPFLRDLLTTLNKTPTDEKRKLIRSECKAFLERHNK
jgi:hypothetical protein